MLIGISLLFFFQFKLRIFNSVYFEINNNNISVNLHNPSFNITSVYYLLMILASVPCHGEKWSRCKIGKQCVPMEKWCDYRVDCMDGSDEKNCGKF